MEQQPIPRFRVTEASVLPLHRLLGTNQVLLKGCDRFEVMADGEDCSAGIQANRGVADRDTLPIGFAMIDLSRPDRCWGVRITEQMFDLRPAIDGDGVRPRQTIPVRAILSGKGRRADRQVLDYARRVENQNDVSGGG